MYAGNRVCGFRVGHCPYYPCQTCSPQEHCTVSVGVFFVSCCLQTGHGLVITYVISLRLLLKIPLPWLARLLPQTSSFAGTSRSRLANAEAAPAQSLGTASAAISALMNTTGSLSCRGKTAIHSHLALWTRGTSLYGQHRLLTHRSSFRHSGTAIAVARIFPTASRKFPSFLYFRRPACRKIASI